MKAELRQSFENVFGFDSCSIDRVGDGIQVTIHLSGCIEHLMSLKADKQVVHAIKTTEDPHWIPSLKQLRRLSAYFRLLHDICLVKAYPGKSQVKKLVRRRRMSQCEVFVTIYGREMMQELVSNSSEAP